MKIEYLNGFKTLRFGRYVVQTRKDDFHGVYNLMNGKLLVHIKKGLGNSHSLECGVE